MSRRYAVAAALALAALGGPLAAEAAVIPEVKPENVRFKSAIQKSDNGKKGTLKVRYRCKGASGLWVSVKQTGDRTKDPALKDEGSSKAAAAWLQSHRNTFTCDGERHTKRFTVDTVEPGSKGRLKNGYARVQFCLSNKKGLVVYAAAWLKVE